MATRPAVKLFAVAVLGGMAATAPASANPDARAPRTLANGRPACGNVVGKAPRPAECDRPITAQAQPIVTQPPSAQPVVAQPAQPVAAQPVAAQPVVAQPAQAITAQSAAQPNAVPSRIDWRSYIDSAAVAASVVIRPRVLRSGRPACGNTVGKLPEPVECSMTDAILEQHPDLATELARL